MLSARIFVILVAVAFVLDACVKNSHQLGFN